MDPDAHARLLGRLIANLHSLEFMLRCYLYQQSDSPHHPLPPGQRLDTMKVGDQVKLNALTDYRDLEALISRYNKLTRDDLTMRVDPSVVAVRDALAHGRVSSPDALTSLSMLKFEKPKRGATTTTVVFAQELTASWLKAETTRVREQIEKVKRAIEALNGGES